MFRMVYEKIDNFYTSKKKIYLVLLSKFSNLKNNL